jgi:hypothetical protein
VNEKISTKQSVRTLVLTALTGEDDLSEEMAEAVARALAGNKPVRALVEPVGGTGTAKLESDGDDCEVMPSKRGLRAGTPVRFDMLNGEKDVGNKLG